MSNWTMFGGSRLETLGDVDEGAIVNNSGVTANDLGAWVSIGTTTFAWDHFVLAGAGSGHRRMIDIGIGASGSQVVVVQEFFIEQASVPSTFSVAIPVRIPAGVEVWVRHRTATNSAIMQLSLTGMAGEPTTPFPAGCRLCEMLNAQTADTSPQATITMAGNTANESAWAEIVAASARRYVGLYLAFSCDQDTSRTATDLAVDIGIGAGGSEVVLIENVAGYAESSRIIAGTVYGPFFVDIPAGTRIAARVRCDTSAADSFAVAVMGLVP